MTYKNYICKHNPDAPESERVEIRKRFSDEIKAKCGSNGEAIQIIDIIESQRDLWPEVEI